MFEKLLTHYSSKLMWKIKEKKKDEKVLVVVNNNPFKELANKYKDYETLFNRWVAQQSLPVEVAVTTVTGAVPGAALGVCFKTLTHHVIPTYAPSRPGTSHNTQPQNDNTSSWSSSLVPYQAIISGGTLEVARNFAVLTSVDAGVSCVMQKLRGKKDVETCLMAGFGSGVMVSLVSGVRGPSAISLGFFFALLKGRAFKVQEKVKEKALRQQAEDAKYKRIKRMLTFLGLTHYEKNFKENFLDDETFFRLHYTALREVGIPVGKSIAILNHIKFYGEQYIFG